jgi:hypothetical protein
MHRYVWYNDHERYAFSYKNEKAKKGVAAAFQRGMVMALCWKYRRMLYYCTQYTIKKWWL